MNIIRLFLIALVCAVFMINSIERTNKRRRMRRLEDSEEHTTTQRLNSDVDYSIYFQKKYFFSYTELRFYYALDHILENNFGDRYKIFPKVRLGDIFDAPSYERSGRNRIRSRHVDFVVVDKEQHFSPVLGIEVNGKSHNSPGSRKSDDFKNGIFEETGIPLLTIRNETVTNKSQEKNIELLVANKLKEVNGN